MVGRYEIWTQTQRDGLVGQHRFSIVNRFLNVKAVLTRRRPNVRAFFAIVQLQSSRRFVFSSSAAAGQSIISSFTSDNHKLPLLQFENDWVDLKSEEWAEKKGMHSHSLSCCQSPHLGIIISSPNFFPYSSQFQKNVIYLHNIIVVSPLSLQCPKIFYLSD